MNCLRRCTLPLYGFFFPSGPAGFGSTLRARLCGRWARGADTHRESAHARPLLWVGVVTLVRNRSLALFSTVCRTTVRQSSCGKRGRRRKLNKRLLRRVVTCLGSDSMAGSILCLLLAVEQMEIGRAREIQDCVAGHTMSCVRGMHTMSCIPHTANLFSRFVRGSR
eukprot:SAG11_NODE_9722_length_886_cov_0.466328_1_plen_166_part_00